MAVKKESVKKESLIGKICIKLAGRDAGQIGVIIDELEGDYVLVDGSVRRRKCNIKHIELLPEVTEIKKGATHTEIVSALKKLGITIVARKSKPAKIEKKQTEKKVKKTTKKVAKSVKNTAAKSS